MVPNFIMIWKKNCILRSFIFPWTKSVKITCFSEHRELMGGSGCQCLCVDALILHYLWLCLKHINYIAVLRFFWLLLCQKLRLLPFQYVLRECSFLYLIPKTQHITDQCHTSLAHKANLSPILLQILQEQQTLGETISSAGHLVIGVPPQSEVRQELVLRQRLSTTFP